MRVMVTGVGGNAEVERGHAVYGCRNGCICLVETWAKLLQLGLQLYQTARRQIPEVPRLHK